MTSWRSRRAVPWPTAMPRITIVTAGHISTSPRVWREAQALSGAGHDVTVVGAWLTDLDAQMDLRLSQSGGFRLVVAADLRPRRGLGLTRTRFRAQRRLAARSAEFGLQSIDALAYAPRAILRAVRATRADLYVAHLLTGIWVAGALLEAGERVAVDMEDWHSEDLASDAHGQRSYMRRLEQTVLPEVCYCSTTSQALARELSRTYSISAPHVIYNGDPASLVAMPGPAPNGPLRILWFSQTLGSDRGLADAWRALGSLGQSVSWEMLLVCNSTSSTREAELTQLPAELRGRVRFESPVPPADLAVLAGSYDVGLALEQLINRNHDLTASNKIFRYLQSGAFVAATATAGQREVLGIRDGLGRLYNAGEADGLAEILATAARDVDRLRASREQRMHDATQFLAYETQSPRLVNAVEQALASRPRIGSAI
jgi:hypothetical protein